MQQIKILWFDSETWSLVPIRRGTDVYLDNGKCIVGTFAFDDGPVMIWDHVRDYRMPTNLYNALKDPSVMIVCHNVFFDRMVLRKHLDFDIPVERFHCTYAQALLHGLPGALGALCEILGVPAEHAKDHDGMRLIRLFCGPKPCEPDRYPDDWEKFLEYARLDVEAMRECYRRMPNWNYVGDEKHLWCLDQRINERGFAIDMQFATEAVKVLQANKEALADATLQATGGVITAATQRDKMLMYICEVEGCFLPDLKAATIAAALEDESLEETTRHLLRLRLDSSKSSTSKYKRLIDSVGAEGRLRGTLQYAGASRTARWAGRIFQPQNLPRPTMHHADTRTCIELIRDGRATLVRIFASIAEACSNGIRGLIVARPGNKLVVADYSAIEGRVLAWVAGEDWKVKAFREGQDLYKLIYSKAFGIDIKDVAKHQRQMGKVMELALGYAGGVGAFVNMASAYGMDLDAMAENVHADEKTTAMALKAWEWALEKNATFGLSEKTYVACDILKIMYRRANPSIAKFWYMVEAAARNVIQSRKHEQVGPIMFDCSSNGDWLRIKLPSGRYLCYAKPRIHADGSISYMSWRNKKWSRTKTYGGKFVENIVQAISRDLLGWALLNTRDVVLHIHDEIIIEVPKDGGYGLAELIKSMTKNPPWARGLPLNAEGFEGERYEKH
jgi:DNA polymerase